MTKKQSSDRLSKLAGRYVGISIESLYAMEPALVVRDVRAMAASVVSQDEKPRKAKR